ncbi:MAG: hypothetical protein AVDCRST_MAG90-2710, partial [uncultured Microvirga sp.]
GRNPSAPCWSPGVRSKRRCLTIGSWTRCFSAPRRARY